MAAHVVFTVNLCATRRSRYFSGEFSLLERVDSPQRVHALVSLHGEVHPRGAR